MIVIRALCLLVLFVQVAGVCAGEVSADQSAQPGEFRFVFSGWAGPPLDVRLYVPERVKPDTPIVIVMHGASRDAIRYFNDWKTQGQRHGFIVAVPEFPRREFAKSAHYNLGHVFDPETRQQRPANQWTFSAIEPLFDSIVLRVDGKQTQYTLFGHSAGAQFVHRFLYYHPAARVKRAIVANAGWYTMPDFGIDYPYGLGDSGVDESALIAALQRDVVILLGDSDTDENADNLRKTPEAELQGPHRLARGKTMYRVAKARAKKLATVFGWRLEIIPGAAHVNAQMTPAAALYVE